MPLKSKRDPIISYMNFPATPIDGQSFCHPA